jgi:hypothetical protein
MAEHRHEDEQRQVGPSSSPAQMTSSLYMTPSPSELSIFGEADVDEELALVEEELNGEGDSNGRVVHFEEPRGNSNNSRSTGTGGGNSSAASGVVTKAERQKLMRELLDALYLGTSNFLLAYNTRAGIGVLLRVFKLLLKR